MNETRPRNKTTPARLRGHAVHVCVLRGRQVFDERYACEPVGNDILYTADDIKQWLNKRGVIARGSKAEMIRRAMNVDRQPPRIYDVLIDEAKKAGKLVLNYEDYERVVIASAMIAKNPKLKDAFNFGMSEVAIFWREGDLMLKALFDYLKIGGVGDLKSITNSMGIDFPEACCNAIARYRYDIQARLYMEARAALPKLVEEGKVWGEHDADWLKRVAAAKTYGWQWVFFQAEDAPITWSKSLLPDNPIMEIAQISINRARDRFRQFKSVYGDSMWVLADDVSELDINELPAWFAMTR